MITAARCVLNACVDTVTAHLGGLETGDGAMTLAAASRRVLYSEREADDQEIIMRDLRFSDTVRRVIQLRAAANGHVAPVVLYERDAARPKKGSQMVRPLERLAHRVAKSSHAQAGKYLARHERSNLKKRDGWVRDFNVNVIRAFQAGQKPLRWDRWISF